MENNIYYFDFSKENPEGVFDSFYKKDKLILPNSPNGENILIQKNRELIDNITEFKNLYNSGARFGNNEIDRIVDNVVGLLTRVHNINYSPFCQFFMVYNTTFDVFSQLSSNDQKEFIYQMLIRYCEERHDMYLSYGYTDAILQIVCDSYSHKRNSKSTIEKILNLLSQYNLSHVSNINGLENNDIYFLPDKGDRALFEQFLQNFDIEMMSRNNEQEKLPDIVFKHNDNYYICELKTMKGLGGGQNKQIVEVANFIRYSETNTNIHYLVFLDGIYPNLLFSSMSRKIVNQRNDITNALNENPTNYFVNTAGFKKLSQDIFE